MCVSPMHVPTAATTPMTCTVAKNKTLGVYIYIFANTRSLVALLYVQPLFSGYISCRFFLASSGPVFFVTVPCAQRGADSPFFIALEKKPAGKVRRVHGAAID